MLAVSIVYHTTGRENRRGKPAVLFLPFDFCLFLLVQPKLACDHQTHRSQQADHDQQHHRQEESLSGLNPQEWQDKALL